jgi:seryl-tRNA synthetase
LRKLKAMLQVSVIRKQRDWVLERLAVKHFGEPALVDQIIDMDDKRKSLLTSSELLLARRNAVSKEIGALMGQGKKEDAEKKKQEVATLKEELELVEKDLSVMEKSLNDALVRLPNLPSALVPKGKTPADNEIVRESGVKPVLSESALPHWDLIKKYDIVDFETGVKITGSGFPLFKGKGAK